MLDTFELNCTVTKKNESGNNADSELYSELLQGNEHEKKKGYLTPLEELIESKVCSKYQSISFVYFD